MAHIDGYADFLVEDVRAKLGYDAKDSSHDDEVLARLTAGEKISKSKHLKQPKYHVGQVLVDNSRPDANMKIITVSPQVDYTGEFSYFIQWNEDGEIWFAVFDEEYITDWFKEVK
ncbi:hypothetical protein PQE71_gp105 [Bacillus phage Izhevsk]|uniref:Uncharacterized protein n=1 Tax=Bacillus phage Izhevsk TaxID=2724322 RepID=A0A6H0X6D7_9CAUD|nr:hypothetical protein PQE71_gp105 [Bacillus phage Izhevsk]QIW89787.1 hypothetical protein Izhevsk_106 [Bacillus phage Izhevsk]